STAKTYNKWLKPLNTILQRDSILTDKKNFGPLTFNKTAVLKTWSGLLLDKDSLPDDWTHEGVLVGI
ncbi:hypothetical protein DFH07DRAFT_752898, partial [Mycena maculata]